MEIAVALSGGIDSAMAAHLLKEEGHNVWAITMVHHRRTEETLDRVKRVAEILTIPLEVVEVREVFQREVLSPFAEAYARGLTPNPCPLCNRRVKLGILMKRAMAKGADKMATGHYARVVEKDNGPHLMKGKDPRKDQSYFLALLTREQLEHLVLPLGEWTRQEVEVMAKKLSLWEKGLKSSQEICFLQGHYTQLLKEIGIDPGPGPIKDLNGKTLGTHKGYTHYTIGQRRGLGIAAGRPLYIVKIIPQENTVIVGPPEALMAEKVQLSYVHWIHTPPGSPPWKLKVKIRYRHREAPALVKDHGRTISFHTPQRAPTPGQLAVFYKEDEVLGGGQIQEVF
ncbi:MAG TPA: tRNA 2-thiouridine(34) synthase MnmA [Thermosulfidibacter takaii]|uniref:tRNA-specific 2-thiouridylase MnmA n=1 Tax=Thermosulfidibacter takaii TaxID=412593 RepID=A0A7C0U5K4_9BACT|nr:tRNA 2-thiouridine(34) synthase MnmA [Thermosulfidibacter takaii]